MFMPVYARSNVLSKNLTLLCVKFDFKSTFPIRTFFEGLVVELAQESFPNICKNSNRLIFQ